MKETKKVKRSYRHDFAESVENVFCKMRETGYSRGKQPVFDVFFLQ